MKHLIVSLFSACLITSYCTAQRVEPTPPPPPKPTGSTSGTNKPVRTVSVTFIPTDTCYLSMKKVGEEKFGNGQIVNKNSPTIIKLSLGNYSLLFESLETGKIIKDRSFRLIKDSLAGYSYPITFK